MIFFTVSFLRFAPSRKKVPLKNVHTSIGHVPGVVHSAASKGRN